MPIITGQHKRISYTENTYITYAIAYRPTARALPNNIICIISAVQTKLVRHTSKMLKKQQTRVSDNSNRNNTMYNENSAQRDSNTARWL